MRDEQIVLLLATYQGEAYLGEQLDSLRAQSLTDWRLLVRDDGSADRTAEILRAYQARDRRITLIADDKGNLGPRGNFAALLALAASVPARYVFLLDQDDRWHVDKLQQQVAALRRAERAQGASVPLLVHADLRMINGAGRIVADSFLRYQRIRHQSDSGIPVLLVQNYVTGCALGINRAALALALPIPATALMHDWWLALVVEATGRVLFIDQALVDYRQHAGNHVGAVNMARGLWLLLRRLFSRAGLSGNYLATLRQCEALLERLQSRGVFDPACADHALIAAYCGLFGQPMRRLERLARVRALGVRRQFWLRDLMLRLQILALGSRPQLLGQQEL